VTIGRQSLQVFQNDRAQEHHAKYKINALWVRTYENRAKNRKRNDVFKMAVGSHVCPHQEWRELEIDRIRKSNMRQRRVSKNRNKGPCREGDKFLRHAEAHILPEHAAIAGRSCQTKRPPGGGLSGSYGRHKNSLLQKLYDFGMHFRVRAEPPTTI